jgi:hypothetical protein
MNTREILIDLITEYGLDRRDVADMVRVKRETVDRWLLPNEASSHEEIPEMAVELLQLKLHDRKPVHDDAQTAPEQKQD